MIQHLRPAFSIVILMTLLTGIAYPLAITGVARYAMPAQAIGSLITKGDTVIGSELIGQNFATDRYFWPRPSATSPDPYNAQSSSGSNLGPTAAKLRDGVAANIKHLKDSGIDGPVPADAVMASGSGLDPDISPAFAKAQVARVAKARGLPETKVAALVQEVTTSPMLGFIGEPLVNVLKLNLALDELKG
ncbi:potassium-transporting ATPase subunit KdpC [Rhizobium sp.]|jgi:potassium-transporting ATPase KdpC subunit|uniref:potassium-transporting ATPase subunit KdpC n=1 Tax=Rhizobium sp. TaxID=391 RepID=UPI000E964D33|nr:potassium-transporting ATPase subunit C [Rhizobium sp.]